MVTSSAVVGSSAISSCGLQASAIAIIARWRWPPESWCGYESTRRSGSGMPVRCSSSMALARAALGRIASCISSTSAIWLPTVYSGLSAVIGSWKIMPMRAPRMARISRSESAVSSLPSKWIVPVVSAASTRRRIESAVIDLPDPDSPTRPNFSPRAMANETSLTTVEVPKRTVRWSIWRSA